MNRTKWNSKLITQLGMVVQTFDPTTGEVGVAGSLWMKSQPVRSTKWIPGQSGLHRVPVSKKKIIIGLERWVSVWELFHRTQVQFPAPTWCPQSRITSVPDYPTFSSGLHSYQACMWYTDIHAIKIPTHIKYQKQTKTTTKRCNWTQ